MDNSSLPAIEHLWPVKKFSDHVGVHVETTRKWGREGRIRTVRMSGRVLIDVTDLSRLVEVTDKPEVHPVPRVRREDLEGVKKAEATIVKYLAKRGGSARRAECRNQALDSHNRQFGYPALARLVAAGTVTEADGRVYLVPTKQAA